MYKAQLRAARAMMGWSQEQLAAAAGVSAQTIKRLEALNERGARESIRKVRSAFERAGIEFINEITKDGEKIGVSYDLIERVALDYELSESLEEVRARLLTVHAFEDDEGRRKVAADALAALERLAEEYSKG